MTTAARATARARALIIIVALALALAMITTTTTEAQAATTAASPPYQIHNINYSAYATNIYTDLHCSRGRYILRPGETHVHPPTRSTKVNAYSRIRIHPGGSYGPLIQPNVCVPIYFPGMTVVMNYSNA